MIFNLGVKCINEIANDDIWIQKRIKKRKSTEMTKMSMSSKILLKIYNGKNIITTETRNGDLIMILRVWNFRYDLCQRRTGIYEVVRFWLNVKFVERE